ncbi:MAG: CHASE domain-containing protein [Methylococcales bacterium]|nr:CHASE domain-containing protein [Methylococcales bacterium]
MGLSASVGFYVILERIDNDSFYSSFEREASERISTIQRSFALNQLAIESSQSFFSTTDDIDHLKFKRFVLPLFSKLPGIKAMEWIPRIKYSEVSKHLSKMQEKGFSGFRLTEKNENGELVDISKRSEYYPVYYVEPYLGNEKAHGFDLASNSIRFRALSIARDTGRSIATDRINLVQSKQDHYGFLIFSPVYSQPISESASVLDRKSSIKGFALGVFQFHEIINTAINIFDDNEFYLQLLDISDLNNKQLLFNNIPETHLKNKTFSAELSDSDIKNVSYSKDFEFLGRTWQIKYVASDLYKNKFKTYLPLLVMFFGIFSTCILTYVFYKRMYEEQRIKQIIKKQSSELYRTNERLELTVKGAQLGLWDWNIQTGHLYWSEHIAPLFGYSAGDLETTYENFFEAIHSDDRPLVLSAINDCIENGTEYNIEHRVVWPDGQIRWVQETGNVIRNDKGIALKMLGVIQDIHLRKVAEEALRESEEKYRCLFEFSEDPMWFIVGEKFVFANKAAANILGYDSVKQLTNTHPSLLSPDYQFNKESSFIKANEMMTNAYQRGYHRFEWLHKKKNGEVFPVEVSLTRIPYEGQNALFCVWRDISERNKIQEQVVQQKKLLDTLHQSTTRFVETGNLRDAMEILLNSLLELTGCEYGFMGEVFHDADSDKPYLTTDTITNIVSDNETTALYKKVKKKELSAYSLNRVFEHVLASGKTFISNKLIVDSHTFELPEDFPPLSSFLGVPIFYGKEFIGIYGIANREDGYDESILNFLRSVDTTLGVIIHSKRMLDADVRNKESLIKTKDIAERANQAKSEFLSSMSHELRTPMNAILGFSQLMEYDESLTDENKENVDEILKAGYHLLDLINEVLELSKIESGDMNLTLEPVEVSLVVEECLNLIKLLAEKRSIQLNYTELKGAVMLVDRTRLKQIIINLLSNAVKYNRDQGSISISVNKINEDLLRLTVTDTGKGLTEDQLTKIFQPFERLNAKNSTIEGTGIGLTISKQIIEAMNGNISVTSTLGSGSSFCVDLPCSISKETS